MDRVVRIWREFGVTCQQVREANRFLGQSGAQRDCRTRLRRGIVLPHASAAVQWKCSSFVAVAMGTDYETDVVAWASEQARLIRAGRFDLLDREHVAEEIEDVGKSEQRELATRMAVLLAHLLKWQHQRARGGASWEVMISNQRQRIVRRLYRTPSLRGCLNDPDWWADACDLASAETGIGIDKLPRKCPWATATEVLDEGWLPNG